MTLSFCIGISRPLKGLDGGGKPRNHLLQGHAALALGCLLGKIGDMYKAHLGAAPVVMMEQGIERIVAYECPGAEGKAGRDAGGSYGAYHLPYRHGSKIGRRAVGDHRGVGRLIAGIVRDSGFPQIDSHKFRRDGFSAPGLADAEDRIRSQLLSGAKHRLGRFAKHCRDAQLGKPVAAHSIRQQPHSLPGGVDGCAAKGVKARDQ